MRTGIKAMIAFAIVAATAVTLLAAAPAGWGLAGSVPKSYDTGIDNAVQYNGRASAYLKSKEPVAKGFGTLSQYFSAEKYVGQRVRFSAFVKTENVAGWAALWMRVDGSTASRSLAFDNMHDTLPDRSLKGTLAWKQYEIVLDVPAGATGIGLGVLLETNGALWINSAKFEVVGTNVPLTTVPVKTTFPTAPVNLDFEK